MSTKCRVCHRELTNPAHIAAGVGPICAQRAARRASVTDGAKRAAYPAEKLARIERNVAKLGQMVATPERWSTEAFALICHWYMRWRNIQRAAKRLAFTAA